MQRAEAAASHGAALAMEPQLRPDSPAEAEAEAAARRAHRVVGARGEAHVPQDPPRPHARRVAPDEGQVGRRARGALCWRERERLLDGAAHLEG